MYYHGTALAPAAQIRYTVSMDSLSVRASALFSHIPAPPGQTAVHRYTAPEVLMDSKSLVLRFDCLVIFRALQQDPTIRAFADMLRAEGDDFARAEAAFVSRLYQRGESWTRYLYRAMMESDNICVRRYYTHSLAPGIHGTLRGELAFLQCLGELTTSQLLQEKSHGHSSRWPFLAFWDTEDLNFTEDYLKRLEEVPRRGYGIFARWHVFTVEADAQGHARLAPVRYPDPQRLCELPGYEREREKVVQNTKALLEGLPAANVLLYGDAGTGKSSTVKAIANEFAGEGLRLIEVRKNQLFQIPELLDTLAQNPLKFILFIDDLSFSGSDDNFAALKAILEGSVAGRARNIAVYATSNRRHLLRESFSAREGDDVHAADTRQEQMSLAARFGLTVTFSRPEKERYALIVSALAEQHGVQMPHDELIRRAEAFAIRAGGRSPRVARQFIEQLEAGVQS